MICDALRRNSKRRALGDGLDLNVADRIHDLYSEVFDSVPPIAGHNPRTKRIHRLNPCDYFMLVLDHVVRRQGLSGNVTVFRADVGGRIDVDSLARAIGRLHGRWPILGARLERRWPWRYRWVDVRDPPDLGVPINDANPQSEPPRPRGGPHPPSEPACPQAGLQPTSATSPPQSGGDSPSAPHPHPGAHPEADRFRTDEADRGGDTAALAGAGDADGGASTEVRRGDAAALTADHHAHERFAEGIVHRELARGIDVEDGGPIRYRLIPGAHRSSLIVSFHHALLDAKGFELLMVTLNTLYRQVESERADAPGDGDVRTDASREREISATAPRLDRDWPDAFGELRKKHGIRERFRRFMRARRFAVERNRIAALRWGVGDGTSSTIESPPRLEPAARADTGWKTGATLLKPAAREDTGWKTGATLLKPAAREDTGWKTGATLLKPAARGGHRLETGATPLNHAAREVCQRVIRIRFDEEESRQIVVRATALCGFAQTSTYYMVAVSRALMTLADRHGRRVDALRIPLSINLRKAGADGPVIGNQLTFIELLLTADELADRSALAASIQRQYKGAIREGRDVDMMCALDAGRLLRPDRYAARRAMPDGTEPFSLYVADLGTTDRRLDTFLGAPLIESLPATTFPPQTGIGVIFAKTAGRLSASIVHTAPPLADDDGDALAAALRREILNRP